MTCCCWFFLTMGSFLASTVTEVFVMKVVLFPRPFDWPRSCSCRSGENGCCSPRNSFRFNFFFFILAMNSWAVGGYSILMSGECSSCRFFLAFLSFFKLRSVCRLFLSLLLLNSDSFSSSSILSSCSVFLYFFFFLPFSSELSWPQFLSALLLSLNSYLASSCSSFFCLIL